MRKKIVSELQGKSDGIGNWLDLEALAEVELTSEDSLYPIESAFIGRDGLGWRAAAPGPQAIRLFFSDPQEIHRIHLVFTEFIANRTQQYTLRWSRDSGLTFNDIVRQQWNFNPDGATTETETHEVELSGVTVLELKIIPDINNKNAIATLKTLLLA